MIIAITMYWYSYGVIDIANPKDYSPCFMKLHPGNHDLQIDLLIIQSRFGCLSEGLTRSICIAVANFCTCVSLGQNIKCNCNIEIKKDEI